jgi:hypothetical protein
MVRSKMDILLTWVGSHDPTWPNPRTKREELGPILSLLQGRRFDAVYLLLNFSKVDNFAKRATGVLRLAERHFPEVRVKQRPVELVSVTDFRELYRVMNHECQAILKEEGREDRNYFAFLSPGTPQMQTVWVLLVQAGLLPARMVQTTPPDLLAPGAPTWREVDLSLADFPQVVSPGETAQLVGVLEAQRDNLQAENQRLSAEVELLRAGGNVSEEEGIPKGFQLREYLVAQERAMYVRALQQSGGNASEAARLLGVEPAGFRARAANLQVRERRGTPRPQGG